MADIKYPKRLRREQSYFGLHFDFHASESSHQIGKNFNPQVLEDLIKKIKPDFVQCDCKGHPGFSSYPTKVGNPSLTIKKDILKIWRNITAKYGVALYVHYSGVWDAQAIKKHPSWARIDENGKRDPNNTSVFGPYVNKLLIPQLKELCDEYNVDGVWLDGECWAVCQDYSKKVIKAFHEKYKTDIVPKKKGDPYFFEFTEFCREGFRCYLEHYVNELHKHNPDFQVASNWAYTSFMPEPANIDVDFLSGDYPMMDGINAGRFESRCLVHQGKPWDMMAWGFCSHWRDQPRFNLKSPVQLKQEAAVVLSLGGAFQIYFMQKKDGSLRAWQTKLMSDVSMFCRERQSFCHKATPVPQIALLFSTSTYYRKIDRLFSPWDGDDGFPIQDGCKGTLLALLESQKVVDVVEEHQLTDRMYEYPLIIVPECEFLDKGFRKDLLEYVEQGGNLMLTGPLTAKMFKKQLEVKFSGKTELLDKWIEHDDWLANLSGLCQKVIPGKKAKILGRLHNDNNITDNPIPAATITKFGKGKIAAVYADFGKRYCKGRTETARKFLDALVVKLFPKPIVEVRGSRYIDVTLNRLNDKLYINLINTSGPHGDDKVYVYEEISKIEQIEINIRLDNKPKFIKLQPQNKKLPYQYSKGIVSLTLESVDIHTIIEIT